MSMQHEYSNNMMLHWGGMKEMKILIDKTGISKKLLESGLPQGKSNNSFDSISIIESFWMSIWIGCFRFSHTAVVHLNDVLRQIFGWKRVAIGNHFWKILQKIQDNSTVKYVIKCKKNNYHPAVDFSKQINKKRYPNPKQTSKNSAF
jgi:hypothetical protein